MLHPLHKTRCQKKLFSKLKTACNYSEVESFSAYENLKNEKTLKTLS